MPIPPIVVFDYTKSESMPVGPGQREAGVPAGIIKEQRKLVATVGPTPPAPDAEE